MNLKERSIIHLNVTDFAVAVERVRDRSLCGRPLIVASAAAVSRRSQVFDMSEEAYQDGVRKGMSLDLAQKYCRKVQVITPRPALYRRAMAALLERVLPYTPLVETGAEDGHIFMDVSGTKRLFGAAQDIAWRVRKELGQELGLRPAWSLASTKMLAKIASRLVRPFGELIVSKGQESAFLGPLSLALLPGLTAQERQVLSDFNLCRIGELAKLSRTQLAVPFQGRGSYLYDASRGRDQTAVRPPSPSHIQMSAEHHFKGDCGSSTELQAVLTSLVHDIARGLRRRRMLAGRLRVCLCYGDGKTIWRGAATKGGSDNDYTLRRLALIALEKAFQRRIRVRSCLLSCDRLRPRSAQLGLFALEEPSKIRQEKVMAALDLVHSRFGAAAIYLGTAP